MHSEVRREVISVLLGGLHEFQNCTGQSHWCGSQTQNNQILLQILSKRVRKLKLGPGVSASAKRDVEAKLEKAKNLVHLLLYFIPHNSISSTQRVDKNMWEDWLKICWGYDHDTLSMLSILPNTVSPKEFVNSVEKLPIIQSPALNNSQQQVNDCHIHSGAIYPPSLQWAYWINTGSNYICFISNKNYHPYDLNGYELDKEKIEEHRKLSRFSHNYLIVARVLLGAMHDFYELSKKCSDLSNSSDNDVKKCYDLIKKVSDMVCRKNVLRREELESLLKEGLPELNINNSSTKWLSKSIKTNVFFLKKDVSSEENEIFLFLKEERKCIAHLLWKAHKNQLGIFIQEILFTYLRCKGAWFQINSGNNVEELNPYEHVLLKIHDLSIVQDENKGDFNRFHDSMSEAVRQFYLDTKPCKVEVRLPFTKNIQEIPQKIKWLDSIYKDNIEWDLVLSFPRFSWENKNGEKGEDLREEYFKFTEKILNILDSKKAGVCGVDLVGANENVDWGFYAKLIKDLRDKICKETGKSCFITYHLDEQKDVHPLKEIGEILTVFNIGCLRENDRISHGWSLLSEADKSNQTDKKEKRAMHPKEFNYIINNLKELTNQVKTEQKEAVQKLDDEARDARDEPDTVYLKASLMSDLVYFFQPLVVAHLIHKNILLEICPTSSWRIADKPLPTQHPVKSWIQAGGKYRVGTDNPAVFPSTIESEYYSLQHSIDNIPRPCVVIFTARKVERDAVLEHISALDALSRETSDRVGQFSANGKLWKVVVPVDMGQGNTNAASTIEKKIGDFKPNVVIFVGTAGGIKDVKLGDVVVASKVRSYEDGKADQEFQLRQEVRYLAHNLETLAKCEADKPDWCKRTKASALPPKVFVEPIASGQKVITSKDSPEYKNILKYCSDAVAVEMEGLALFSVVHKHPKVAALIVRGISDIIGEGKNQNEDEYWQPIALSHASAFAFELLAKLQLDESCCLR